MRPQPNNGGERFRFRFCFIRNRFSNSAVTSKTSSNMSNKWLNGKKNGTGEDASSWRGHTVFTFTHGDYTTKRELLSNLKRSAGLSPRHSFVLGGEPKIKPTTTNGH